MILALLKLQEKIKKIFLIKNFVLAYFIFCVAGESADFKVVDYYNIIILNKNNYERVKISRRIIFFNIFYFTFN